MLRILISGSYYFPNKYYIVDLGTVIQSGLDFFLYKKLMFRCHKNILKKKFTTWIIDPDQISLFYFNYMIKQIDNDTKLTKLKKYIWLQ